MRSLGRPLVIAFFPTAGAMAVLACAADVDVELGNEQPPSLLDGGVEAAAPDAISDAQDAGNVQRCSASGLCIVEAPIDTRINVTSVSGSGPNDVWGVGTSRTIIHYNGSAWEKASPIPNDAASFTMRAVWVGGPSDVWIADGPMVRHSTGWKGPSATEWEATSLTGTAGVTLATPGAISGKDGTVVIGRQLPHGSDEYETPMVTAAGWGADGLVEPVYVESNLFTGYVRGGVWAIAMTRPDEVWMTNVPTDLDSANRVVRAQLVSPDAGEPEAGPSWQTTAYDSRTERNLYGVWGNAEAVWLVGEGGVLRRMTPAGMASRVFETIPSPVNADLRGVYGFSANDVWAVGDDATVIHWNGEAWTKIASPFDTADEKPRLFAVWGSSPNDVWIGGNGVMLHFEGKAP